MKNFPYTVEEGYANLKDGLCCHTVTDHTGFHFYRCSKKVKEYIDGVGLCGIHARSVKIWRKNSNIS